MITGKISDSLIDRRMVPIEIYRRIILAVIVALIGIKEAERGEYELVNALMVIAITLKTLLVATM